jgi:hypothetical protein
LSFNHSHRNNGHNEQSVDVRNKKAPLGHKHCGNLIRVPVGVC